MKRLPGVATRDGDTLKVALYPSGTATFTDVDTISGGTSYALWDYLVRDQRDGALGDARRRRRLPARAAGHQPADPAARRAGALARPAAHRDGGLLPAALREPARGLARHARRRACASRSGRPRERWSDAGVRWKSQETLVVDYTVDGAETGKTLERRLADRRLEPRRRQVSANSAADRCGPAAAGRPPPGAQLRAAAGADVAGAAARARRTPAALRAAVRARAARLAAGVRPRCAGGAGDRLRHGRDDGGDRRRTSGTRLRRHRGACAGRRQPAPRGRPARTRQRARDPSRRGRGGRCDDSARAPLAGIHVFFPDPWPKKRHHKRRLLKPDFVHALALPARARRLPARRDRLVGLRRGDARDSRGEPLLANTVPGFAPRPESRPRTKFERRGTRLGHPVFDLLFTRK